MSESIDLPTPWADALDRGDLAALRLAIWNDHTDQESAEHTFERLHATIEIEHGAGNIASAVASSTRLVSLATRLGPQHEHRALISQAQVSITCGDYRLAFDNLFALTIDPDLSARHYQQIQMSVIDLLIIDGQTGRADERINSLLDCGTLLSLADKTGLLATKAQLAAASHDTDAARAYVAQMRRYEPAQFGTPNLVAVHRAMIEFAALPDSDWLEGERLGAEITLGLRLLGHTRLAHRWEIACQLRRGAPSGRIIELLALDPQNQTCWADQALLGSVVDHLRHAGLVDEAAEWAWHLHLQREKRPDLTRLVDLDEIVRTGPPSTDPPESEHLDRSIAAAGRYRDSLLRLSMNDVRSLLTALQLTLSSTPTEQSLARSIVHRMHALVEQFDTQDPIVPDAERRESIDLCDLVRTATAEAMPLHQHLGVQVQLDLPPSIEIRVDPRWMRLLIDWLGERVMRVELPRHVRLEPLIP